MRNSFPRSSYYYSIHFLKFCSIFPQKKEATVIWNAFEGGDDKHALPSSFLLSVFIMTKIN